MSSGGVESEIGNGGTGGRCATRCETSFSLSMDDRGMLADGRRPSSLTRPALACCSYPAEGVSRPARPLRLGVALRPSRGADVCSTGDLGVSECLGRLKERMDLKGLSCDGVLGTLGIFCCKWVV